MAKFNISFDVTKDAVVKTLTFAGREFEEVWTDNGCSCQNPITEKLKTTHLDIPEYIIGQIEEATCIFALDAEEVMSMLHELQEYEVEMFVSDSELPSSSE